MTSVGMGAVLRRANAITLSAIGDSTAQWMLEHARPRGPWLPSTLPPPFLQLQEAATPLPSSFVMESKRRHLNVYQIAMTMPQVSCGSHRVGKMGFGLMLLSWGAQSPPEEASFAAMKAAVDNGATLWSTAVFYGGFDNLRLIGAFFRKYPEYKDKIVLSVKGGNAQRTVSPINTYENALEDIQGAKQALGGKTLDVFSFARLDPDWPKEEQYKLLKRLVDEGHVSAVAACEMSAKSCEEMSKYIKPVALEIEISLWSYDQDVKDAIAWSTRTQTPIMAYSPLGRGFLTRTYKSPEDVPPLIRARGPRFQGQAFYGNLRLVDQLDELSKKKGISTSELALAWVAGLGEYIIPIPGSSKPDRIKANCGAVNVTLTREDWKEVNRILDGFKAQGDRYPDAAIRALMQ